MRKYLLDTNIPSELLRIKPNQQVVDWVSSQDSSLLYISVVTIGEIWKGIALLADGKRRNSLELWLKNEFIPWFEGRILPITEEIATNWGLLEAARQIKGRALNIADGQIAATASVHNLVVVTRNVKDFADLGIEIFNPWKI